jgi:predicted  nucleic acid-binding Zn-ribbon protein
MRSKEQDAVNFMLRIPDSALDTIQATIMDNLRPIRNKFEQDFQNMQHELANLKSKVLDANDEKSKIQQQIELARADIVNHR